MHRFPANNRDELILRSGVSSAASIDDELASPQAWILGSALGALDRLAIRLQRDGWLIRRAHGMQDADMLLNAGQHGASPPALVIAAEGGEVSLEDLRHWCSGLPHDTRCIWGTSDPTAVPASGSGTAGRIEIRRFPLGPADVRNLGEVGRQWQSVHFAGTSPAPLDSEGRPRVLVVDDNLVNRVLASEMLRMLKYDADEAQDGRQALEYLQRYRPRVILMDYHMPVMDGAEATRRLRRLERAGLWPRTPVIAITAASEREKRVCRSSGMDIVLSKPIILTQLQAALSAATGSQSG